MATIPDKEKKDAEEAMHMRNLMESASGRWMLGEIIHEFERELRRRTSGHNSDDSYHRGIQDTCKTWRDLVIKHFGNKGIDRLESGK